MAKTVLSNTDKFYHKGDIDLTQIKGLLGSNPSIVNFSSIFLAV